MGFLVTQNFVFDLGHNYSVTHIRLYQSSFLLCITKCKKMMFMSVWNRTHTCSGVRFRKQSKCSNGFHSVKTAEKKVYKHCVRH